MPAVPVEKAGQEHDDEADLLEREAEDDGEVEPRRGGAPVGRKPVPPGEHLLLEVEELRLLFELEGVDGIPVGLVGRGAGLVDEPEIGRACGTECGDVVGVDLLEHHLGRQPAGDEHELDHARAELGPQAVAGRQHAHDEGVGLGDAELEEGAVDGGEPLAGLGDPGIDAGDLLLDRFVDEERLARAEDGERRAGERVNGAERPELAAADRPQAPPHHGQHETIPR